MQKHTQTTAPVPAQSPVMMGVLTAIADQKRGASLGAMLATVHQHGCTLDQFNTLIQRLARTGVVRLEDDPYKGVPATAHLTDLGQGVLRVLNQQKASRLN